MGALLTALATRAGAHVTALSRRSWSLEVAQAQGATSAFSLGDRTGAVRSAKERTGGAGFERVIEAAGTQEAIDVATELVGVNGRLLIAGYHQDGLRRIDLQKWNWQGIDVINAHERHPQVYVTGMRAALDAVASGHLDPAPLFTQRLSLSELNDAFDLLERRPDGFVKALVMIE